MPNIRLQACGLFRLLSLEANENRIGFAFLQPQNMF